MKNNKKELTELEEKTIKLVRALANGVGIILFMLLLINAIQQGGLDRLISLNGKETISFVCILVMFFGMVWSTQKALAAGILIIVTYIVLAINLGTPVPDPVLPMFFLVGALHLYLGIKAH